MCSTNNRIANSGVKSRLHAMAGCASEMRNRVQLCIPKLAIRHSCFGELTTAPLTAGRRVHAEASACHWLWPELAHSRGGLKDGCLTIRDGEVDAPCYRTCAQAVQHDQVRPVLREQPSHWRPLADSPACDS